MAGNAPLSPEERERLDNYLLERYQKGRATADESLGKAKNMNYAIQGADVLGNALTTLGNANNSAQFLYNPLKNLGSTPRKVGGEDQEWDGEGMRRIGSGLVKNAEADRARVGQDLTEEQKIREMDRSNRINARDDAFKGESQGQTRVEWARENKNAPLEDEFAEQKRGQSRTQWDRENRNAPLEDTFDEEKRGEARKGFDQNAIDRERKNRTSKYEDQDMDVESTVSKNATTLLKSALLSKAAEAEKAGDRASAKSIREQAKGIKMGAREAYDTLKILQQMDWRALITSDNVKERAKSEKVKDINPMVLKASQELGTHQVMQEAFGGIDKALGRPLDSFTTKGGDVYDAKTGKYIDLPGVSVRLPGIGGRYTMGSSKAQDIDAAASTIFNTILKDRSGAAVSDSEMDRIRTEFQNGKFNTEGGLIRAMQDYKRAATRAMQNAEAGFAPEVLGEYRNRGGRTTQDYQNQKPQRTEVKRQYSPSRNKTRIKYSDGSEEVIDGR